jgi:heme-degrading monooxygenase HmoA
MVAFGTPGGAVVRQWKGVVTPGKAGEYVFHLRTHTLPALAKIEGFVTYSVMRRDVEDGVEFQVLTIWRSLDAIRPFAGEDVTRAVVPPAAQALMVRYDDRAVHYDIVQ